jgi:hypothetical protein
MSLVLPLAYAGCDSQVATFPVVGTLSFDDGEPVPYGSIEFRHEESGISARGTIDRSGAFSLGTFSANDGAPAGSYRVIVVQYFNAPPPSAPVRMEGEHGDHGPHADIRVAAEVADYSTSSLRAEVRPDASNKIEFIVPRYRSARERAQRTGDEP